MKYLISSLSLTLWLLMTGVVAPVFAQSQVLDTGTDVEVSSESENTLRIGKGGIKIDVDFDDDESNQEKLEKVADLIGDTLNKDVGDGLSVEFKTLDEDEKEKLVEAIESGFSIKNDGSHKIPAAAILLTLIGIVLFFGTPVFLLFVLLHSGYKKRRQKMELVTMYLQADRELPEHVINAIDNGGAASSLRSGLGLTTIGLGLIVAFNVSGDGEVAAFGFIPMFIGLGRLAFWYLDERKHDNTNDQTLNK